MNREQTLHAALTCVTKDRNSQYGSPEDSFRDVAEMWSILLGAPVTAAQVTMCMAALKLVRLKRNPAHEDSWVDLAGYAACGAEVSGKRGA